MTADERETDGQAGDQAVDDGEIVYIESEAGPAECLRCGLRVDRVTPGYVEGRETPVEGREECPRCGDLGKPRIYRWDEEVA